MNSRRLNFLTVTGKLPAILRFFGCKWDQAEKYPKPRYGPILEGFAGGAGYSHLYFSNEIILCEKDPIIYSIWEYLLQATSKDILSLPLLLPGQFIPEYLSNAEKALLGFWVTIAPAKPQRRMVPSSRTIPSAFWNEKIRNRLACCVNSIKHWKVFNYNFIDYYNTFKPKATTIFIDPPYQFLQYYQTKFNQFDELAKICLQDKDNQIIVCEQHPANWLPFRIFGKIRTSPRLGREYKYSRELIWTNEL